MNAAPRKRQGGALDPGGMRAALTLALPQRGCSAADVERARALWQEFVAAAGDGALAGTVESWCAALHYLVAVSAGQAPTQKGVGALYATPASTVSARLKLLRTHLAPAALAPGPPHAPPARPKRPPTPARSPRAQATPAGVLAAAPKLARPTAPPPLDDAAWTAIFRRTHRLLSPLYRDKTHIEILRLLAHVELNLRLAGYQMPRQVIQDRFGRLFRRLGVRPAKGRDPRKFVYLEDIFGTREPFVLVALEHEDD